MPRLYNIHRNTQSNIIYPADNNPHCTCYTRLLTHNLNTHSYTIYTHFILSYKILLHKYSHTGCSSTGSHQCNCCMFFKSLCNFCRAFNIQYRLSKWRYQNIIQDMMAHMCCSMQEEILWCILYILLAFKCTMNMEINTIDKMIDRVPEVADNIAKDTQRDIESWSRQVLIKLYSLNMMIGSCMWSMVLYTSYKPWFINLHKIHQDNPSHMYCFHQSEIPLGM